MRNLICYLLGGFSIFCSVSCTDNVKGYSVDWIYINETDHFVSYRNIFSDTAQIYNEYNLGPHDTVIFREYNEGEKKLDRSNFVPFLRPDIVVFDMQFCWILDRSSLSFVTDEGPTGTENFEYKIINKKERDYVLIYRFTETDFKKAVLCSEK